MSKIIKTNDPFAERESKKYSHPIPSREFILDQLESSGVSITFESLCVQLDLNGAEEIEGLRRRLIAMSRDGQVIESSKGGYCLPNRLEFQKGVVQGIKDGAGYFIPDEGGDDLFLGLREMKRLFDGDTVLARFRGLDQKGRKEGTVVEILQRRFSEIVGRFYKEKSFASVIAENKRINHEILISEDECGKAQDGDFVVAELLSYPDRRSKATGRIKEVLGDVTTPGLEVDVAIRSFDLPYLWPASVTRETSGIPKEVEKKEKEARFDLRDVPFVTIDGEDAKDFDDAVFAHKHQRGGWTLYVAIADVSHYVGINSSLDREARNRGTSVYFPGHVIPMLPEALSNGLCSLKPNVDRLSMICEMEISKGGEIADYCFYEAIIHSHARMTYTEVADILQKPENEIQEKSFTRLRKKYFKLVPHFENLYSLFHARKIKRDADGAMEFESTETRIVFGQNKKLKEILPVSRNEAHKIIEECMLCANISAAQLLERFKVPALYRVHEGPNPEKLDNVRQYLSSLGLNLGGGGKPTPADYSKLLSKTSGRADSRLLHTMLIRSMMQAVYQLKNIGHFGLGFPTYTHFTSPIRRYPDLLVHRAIRYLVQSKSSPHLRNKNPKNRIKKQKIYPYVEEEIQSLGLECSNSERRADSASYSVLDWLKCEYMETRLGEEFVGTITSVTSFGLFVELDGIYIEGLVHVTDLHNDYYHYDPNKYILEGERTKKVFKLGDKIEVQVARVDVQERKIDLKIKSLKASDKIGRGRKGSTKKSRKPTESKLGAGYKRKSKKHNSKKLNRKAKK